MRLAAGCPFARWPVGLVTKALGGFGPEVTGRGHAWNNFGARLRSNPKPYGASSKA